MHKWESTEKLLTDWEHQVTGENFNYIDFDYQKDEFDNVPPVVPRFLFYLQLCLKPVTTQLQTFLTLETTEHLKAETLEWLAEIRQTILDKEKVSKAEDVALQKRCDDLQAQIDQINQQRAAEKEVVAKKASDSMLSAEHFKFEPAQAECETEQCSYMHQLMADAKDVPSWHEPRMLTLKQLRDTFFSMLLQSKLHTKSGEHAQELVKITQF